MAEWTTAYVNDLPASAFACPDSRKYPHHDKSGALDLPHLRAALSRIGDPSNEQCGRSHLEAHAKSAGVGQKALAEVKATILDDDRFRLLAIPFGGPLPSAKAPRGVDMDGEWFSERTDIKPGWFDVRLVDWHHRGDRAVGKAVIGKAYLDAEPEEDGWWVEMWLQKSSEYLGRIKRLVERGLPLFGSSESVPGMVRRDKATGEILVWPYVRQTLSPLPRNTFSVLTPLKATLDEQPPTAAFFDDLARFIDDLASDPPPNPAGDGEAKAGRVLASRNEARLREARELLNGPFDESFQVDTKRLRQATAALDAVLDELDRYLKPIAL